MSLLCLIDFRYGRPKMKGIFHEEARLQRLLDVEAALARAEAKVGLIAREAGAEISKKATTKHVSVKRVEELVWETRSGRTGGSGTTTSPRSRASGRAHTAHTLMPTPRIRARVAR